MENEKEDLLGFLVLETGLLLVSPMNDVFVNYTYERKANWEQLRKLVNIFYKAYIEICKNTQIEPIEGISDVETQFAWFKDPKNSTPKRQDVRIESVKKVDFLEVQNDNSPDPPISKRSTDYYGFALARGSDKQQSSIWLINGSVSELLDGEIFANYVLMNEKSHRRHPNASNILYVDLNKLAQEDSQAGELARVLIGEESEPIDDEVKEILYGLRQSFKDFKEDKEVKNIMSRDEQKEKQGIKKAEARLLPIIEEKDKQLSEKDEQIAVLKAMLAGQYTLQKV